MFSQSGMDGWMEWGVRGGVDVRLTNLARRSQRLKLLIVSLWSLFCQVRPVSGEEICDPNQHPEEFAIYFGDTEPLSAATRAIGSYESS
jgi:hypothetical protein